jgi:hypothetical protein
MSLAALSVFEFANYSAGEKIYDVQVLSEDGAAMAPSTCCRWSRERHDDLETGIDRRDYAAIATRVTSAHVVNA